MRHGLLLAGGSRQVPRSLTHSEAPAQIVKAPTSRVWQFLIIAAGALFFIPFLGGMNLIDWDEANFAEVSREMIVTGNYLDPTINYEPFHEKPPLFFWLQSVSMRVFGIHEFAARFPNAIAGIITLLVLFSIGRRLYNDHKFGLLWVAFWFASYLPHFYFKSGIIDPWYNLFTFLGLYFMIRLSWTRRVGKEGQWRWVVASGFFLGLAVLTKGPVALGLILLAFIGHMFVSKLKLPMSIGQFGVFMMTLCGVAALWLLTQYLMTGGGSVVEFVEYQYRLFSTPDGGHSGFPGFHVVMLLIGCFPASVLAFGVIGVKPSHRQTRADFAKWMHVLLIVVIVVFSIVQTKIVHYTSLAYYPVTFLAALTFYRVFMGRRFNRGLKISLATAMGVVSLVLLAVPFFMSHPQWLEGISNDPLTKTILMSDVQWSMWTYAPGVLLLMLTLATISLWLRRLRKAWVYVFLAAMPLVVASSIIVYAPKVEHYTQRPAIEFFKQLEGKDVDVICYKYKSYAHYFYAKVMPQEISSLSDHDLLTAPIERDVYISARVDRADELRRRMDIEELGSGGGFVFFKRARPGIPL